MYAEEAKARLLKMFKKFPVYKVDYDDDCIDLCLPNSLAVSNASYAEIMGDTS